MLFIIYVTWTTGHSEGDARRKDSDPGIGGVFAEQLDQHDAAFHERPQTGITQPLDRVIFDAQSAKRHVFYVGKNRIEAMDRNE